MGGVRTIVIPPMELPVQTLSQSSVDEMNDLSNFGANYNGLVAFVHIPKTAGTTLNSILAREYSPEETYEIMMRGMSLRVQKPTIIPRPLISYSKVRRLKSALKCPHTVRLIRGHFDLSLAKILPRNTPFFTLLRDPVERAISHYYHYRRQINDPIHPLAMRSTLTEWICRCGLVEMDNGQTRRLAGGMNVPCGHVTLQMIDCAKANLARHFAVVGLTERFDESLILLRRAFNWPLYRITAKNVGDSRPRRTEVSEEELKIIEDRNRFDLDVYQFVCTRFQQTVDKMDMASELGRLRAAPESIESKRAGVPVERLTTLGLVMCR